MKTQHYPVKGTIPDIDYNKLCDDKFVDKLKNKIAIGDKVIYHESGSKSVRPVQIGEVEDFRVEYSKKWNWDITTKKYSVQPDMSSMTFELKIKQESGGPKIYRLSNYVVKVK